MFSKSLLKGYNKSRLRSLLAIIFLALSIPTGVLIWQAYSQLKWEAFHQYRVLAEELNLRIDARLIDMINTALSLPASYFSNGQCENIGDDCNDFLNAAFVNGFSDQEQNQGSDPMDWRSTALDNAVYLSSVFPNGINWDSAFDQTFTPGL